MVNTSLFNLGLSGLLASQRGLSVTGHNIANVNTPGYSRQTVEFVTRPAQGAGNGFTGQGVQVKTTTREVEAFIVEQLRAATTGQAQSQAFRDLAVELDNLLGDPTGGLAPAVQSFFKALHDVAADPASVPARQVLLSDAEGLINRFRSIDGRLAQIRASIEGGLRDQVSEVNSLAKGLAEVNREIVRSRASFSDQPPNDLLDQRDELLRELSERIEVDTLIQDDGALNVLVGNGQPLVLSDRAFALGVVSDPFDPTRLEVSSTVGGSTTPISNLIRGGEIAGLIGFRDQVLDPAARTLGLIAVGLAQSVNDQHALGTTLTGAPGGAFFTPVDQLSPAVLAHRANTGAPPAQVSVAVTDVSSVAQSAYLLERSGATHTLTRLSDNTVFVLGTFPAGPEVVDGLTLSLPAGTIADGDRFLIEPSRFAIADLGLAVSSPSAVAAAAPVRAAAGLGNIGSASISAPVVNHPRGAITLTFDTPPTTFDVVDADTGAVLLTDATFTSGAPIALNGLTFDITGAPAAGDVFRVDNGVSRADPANAGGATASVPVIAAPDPNLTDTVTITFTSAGTFDVSGATTGSPTVGIPYVSGAPLSFNGWTIAISGTPQAGDTFVVEVNAGGVGDNRNALALADLQTALRLDGERSTFEEVHGQLVARVGAATRQAGIELSARAVLLEQVRGERDAVSGVNLDEEAANLLRFQQTFQASAQVIAAVDELFQSLLAAVS